MLWKTILLCEAIVTNRGGQGADHETPAIPGAVTDDPEIAGEPSFPPSSSRAYH
jgi:hypothetical protein